MTQRTQGIVLVSNRLPISFEFEGKELHSSRSSGGLVTALEPLLKEHGGVWSEAPERGVILASSRSWRKNRETTRTAMSPSS